MCLCILAHQLHATYPTIIAANREERYDRPTDPPGWKGGIFAGRDRSAGGTWQGVNRAGMHVALTNRRGTLGDPERRSRGLLCTDALRYTSARAACDWLLDHLLHEHYNPCNVLLSDGVEAFCVHYDGRSAHPKILAPGLHLLGDTEVDDPQHLRIRRARQALYGPLAPWSSLQQALADLMAEHSDADDGLCLHGTRGGTRSSALIALGARTLNDARFHYADGPPCTTPYADLSPHLQKPV